MARVSDGGTVNYSTVIPMCEAMKQLRNGTEFSGTLTRRPSQWPSIAGASRLRLRAARYDGEVIWRNQRRIRSVFGTMVTLRKQGDFMPRPFPIHPSVRYISRRETFHPGRKAMC